MSRRISFVLLSATIVCASLQAESSAIAFEHNSRVVSEHNARYAVGLETYTLALNRFANISREEWTRAFRPLVFSPSGIARAALRGQTSAVPASVDWRTTGVVGPVQNQGQCGSDWALVAAGAIQSAAAIKRGDRLVVLSSQVWC